MTATPAEAIIVVDMQRAFVVGSGAVPEASRLESAVNRLLRDSHGSYPIPADGDAAVAVPAAHVARVTEWSLGDELIVVDLCDDVSSRSTRLADASDRRQS